MEAHQHHGDSFADKFGVQIQVAVLILFFLENLMVAFFKATIVFYLRFQAQLTENQSILSYHIFQAVAYFSAFFNGLLAMQSMQGALIVLLIFYMIGGSSLFYALLGTAKGDPLIPVLIALFGLGHGALKSAIHRMIKATMVGKAFGYLSLALVLIEFLLVGILPMLAFEGESATIVTLLVVVMLFLILAVFGSLFDKHDQDLYSFGALTSATIYGLVGILVKAEEEINDAMHRRPRKKGAPKLRPVKLENGHWMDRAIGKYPLDMINDLKEKFRLHKLYFGMAGLWIGVEMKYSYWIFNAYLTRRIVSEDIVIHPPQFVALTPLIFALFAPLFYLILRPMLSWSFYKSSLRQMCLGGFFVISATVLSWRLSAMQIIPATEFIEADLSQQKVRVLNAYDCQSGFSYYFSMNPDLQDVFKPMPAINYCAGVADGQRVNMLRKPQVEIITNLLLPSIEESFLRYANIRFLDKVRIGEVLWDKQETTDSFTYLMHIHTMADHAVTLSAYGYCEDLNQYSLKIPLMHNRSNVDHWLVYIIQNKGSMKAIPFHGVNYARNMLQKPGIRLYIAADDKPQVVTVSMGSNVIIKAPVHKNDLQGPSDIVWVSPKDDPIITIKTMSKKMQFNYTLGTAEVVDILVYVHNNGTAKAKLLHALSPLNISGFEAMPQYMIIAVGEFMLGIVGIQQLITKTPHKLRFYVYIDWYLMLGFANILIIMVSQVQKWIALHQQVTVLSSMVLTSFGLLILMACRL